MARRPAPTSFRPILEKQSLADVLDAGRHHLIADAVWHDGVRQPDRTGLIARVQALPANLSISVQNSPLIGIEFLHAGTQR